jgi:hypothetical protein
MNQRINTHFQLSIYSLYQPSFFNCSIHKGRDISEIDTHVQGQNSNSIGICYIGSNEKVKDTRTDAQKASLVKLVAELKE